MNHLKPLRILRVVFGLTFFWSVVLWAFTVGLGTYNPGFLLTWITSIAIGFWMAELHSDKFHIDILSDLHYDFDAALPLDNFQAFYSQERGIFSHLGPVPFHRFALKQLDADQDELLSLAKQHCPTEFDIEGLQFLHKYIEKNRDKYPGHVRLLTAILATYLHPEQAIYPAGFGGRHGGRSLLMHSLLVSGLCAKRVEEFTYELPHGLEPKDQNFKLDKDDPLLVLVGLAHDIGKFECLQFNKDGQACAIGPSHDSIGARLIALMDEYWDNRIDIEERRILQTILAFYHHPSEVPVEKVKAEKEIIRVSSDRLHAILELLIHCDTMAGHMEAGKSFKEATKKTQDTVAKAAAGTPDAMINAFFSHLGIKAGINTRTSGSRSVAFKLNHEEHTMGRTYLYFDEAVWREEFMLYIKSDQAGIKQGQNHIHPITLVVLNALNEHGYLVDLIPSKNTVGKSDSVAQRLYSIEFVDPVSGAVGVQFRTSFVVDITDITKLKGLTELPNCHSMPKEIKQRYGARGRTRSADDAIVQAEMTGTKPAPIGLALCEVAAGPSKKLMAKTSDELTLFFMDQQRSLIEDELKGEIKILNLFDLGQNNRAWALKGLEPYFEDRGFDLQHLVQNESLTKKLGFIRVKPSTQKPGTYVWLVPEKQVRKSDAEDRAKT